MTKRMILMLILVALVLGGVFGFKAFVGMQMAKGMKAAGMPAQTVSTVKAAITDWQPKIEAVGSFRAVNGADLSAEVSGIVESIAFDSGSDVEKGAVLVQLRAEDDVAKLDALQATAKLADITYERDRKLLESKAVSQATADSDEANLSNAKAQVAEQQAIVDKKTIRAPFAGHLGIRQVDVGQYLNPGSAIATLQQLDPLYADFNVPEGAMTQLALGQKVAATTDAFPGASFEGEITALNSRVDESTRNVQVRASFKNPDHKLLPGMFATVTVDSGTPQRAITLPQTAITFNPYGNTVYVVDASNPDKPATKQVFVTTGATRGDQVAITSGLKEGDEVVSAGQLKLRNGMPITVNNSVQPKNDPAPKVPNE
jgi:membrane fusion protein (multidrug efflux system)